MDSLLNMVLEFGLVRILMNWLLNMYNEPEWALGDNIYELWLYIASNINPSFGKIVILVLYD